MIEKPNKDGKPPTIEYQEEEILVSTKKMSVFILLRRFIGVNVFHSRIRSMVQW